MIFILLKYVIIYKKIRINPEGNIEQQDITIHKCI